MGNEIFRFIMEAEGDLVEDFNPNDIPADEPTVPPDQPAGNDTASNDPPEMAQDEDIGFSDQDMMGDEGGTDGNEEADGENKDNQKLSEKANNILNEKLYQQFTARNNEIKDIIESLQQIAPALPFDVVHANDVHINKLKAALNRAQSYVINDFVDSGYGENQLQFQKVDSLYTLLLNSIDSNLKKVDKQ